MNFYRRAPPRELLFLRLGALLFAAIALTLGYLILRCLFGSLHTVVARQRSLDFFSELTINADRSVRIKESFEVDIPTSGPFSLEREFPARIRYAENAEATPRYFFDFARLNSFTADGLRRTLSLTHRSRRDERAETVIVDSEGHEVPAGEAQVRLEYSVLGAIEVVEGRERFRWNITRLDEPGPRVVRVVVTAPPLVTTGNLKAEFYTMILNPGHGWHKGVDFSLQTRELRIEEGGGREQVVALVEGGVQHEFGDGETAIIELSWPLLVPH